MTNYLKDAMEAEFNLKQAEEDFKALGQKLKELEIAHKAARKAALSYLQGEDVKAPVVELKPLEDKVEVKPEKKIKVLKKIKRVVGNNQINEEERKNFQALLPELKKTSRTKLAKSLGVSVGAIYCWYARQGYPRPSTYRDILKFLGKN